MVQGATQQPLDVPKPHWYCRRGWQIFLALVSLFAVWLTWAIVVANDREAIIRKIKETPDCEVQYGWPDWVSNLGIYSWLPERFADWVYEQVGFADAFHFGGEKQLSIDEHLLAEVADRSWPSLASLRYHKQKLWTGNRLLLPLRCPNLKHLMLDQTNLTDDHLESALRHYPSLYSLDIFEHTITDRALNGLHELPELRQLELAQCNIANLDFLEKTPRLESLSLSKIGISDQHLKSIRNCTELINLHLNHLALKGFTLDQLRNCKKLVTLRLENTEIDDRNIRLLPQLPALAYLSLEGNGISGVNLFANGVPSELETLEFNKTKVQLKHLGVLKGHSTLCSINLDDTPTTDEGSEWLGTLAALYTLSMNNTNIGDKTIQALLPATKLQYLMVNHTSITDASGVSFRQMPKLVSLQIDQTAISNDFLAALSGHPTLAGLSIENTRVNDQGVSHLLKIPKLQHVYASPGQFSPKAIQQLKEREIEVILPDEPEPGK